MHMCIYMYIYLCTQIHTTYIFMKILHGYVLLMYIYIYVCVCVCVCVYMSRIFVYMLHICSHKVCFPLLLNFPCSGHSAPKNSRRKTSNGRTAVENVAAFHGQVHHSPGMCVCRCVCMYTYMHTYIHANTRNLHTYMYIYICI